MKTAVFKGFTIKVKKRDDGSLLGSVSNGNERLHKRYPKKYSQIKVIHEMAKIVELKISNKPFVRYLRKATDIEAKLDKSELKYVYLPQNWITDIDGKFVENYYSTTTKSHYKLAQSQEQA